MSTDSIRKVLSTKHQTLNTKSTKYLTDIDVQNRAMGIAEGLTDDLWTKWYCKAYRTLGENKYIYIVGQAKTGKNPKTLFGHLLKQELNRSSSN